MDHAPVLALCGQASTLAIGGAYQQEVDLNALFKDVASAYSITVTNPGALRTAVDRAIRIALTERSVTAVILPKDVQELKAVETPPHEHNTVHTGVGYTRPRVLPTDTDLRRAADVLNAGKRVAMLVGAGAAGAYDELVQVADRLGAGCAKALLGKAVLPDDLPWVTGTIGLLGTQPSSDMMRECDTLFMIGSGFPYGEFLPKEDAARGVQIDLDGKMLGLRFPMEVNLEGDARETLRALLPLLEAKESTEWRERIAGHRHAWNELSEARANVSANPINPQLVFRQLSPKLPDGCIVTGDAGTATNWLARELEMRRGMLFSLSGSLATMGSAVPYAIAAKFAFPDRLAIALTGDGAMQMNGLAELITIAKYWKRWSDPRLVIMVLNNRDLNQVTWEMRTESGEPTFPESQDLPDVPYSEFARMLGLDAIRVDRPEDIGPAWDAALGAVRPAIVEIYTDPNVAMLPPHITLEQAKSFAQALAKGDPQAGGVIVESVSTLLAGIVPGGNGERP
jgi:pyruvate dehydrogenase (quinone)